MFVSAPYRPWQKGCRLSQRQINMFIWISSCGPLLEMLKQGSYHLIKSTKHIGIPGTGRYSWTSFITWFIILDIIHRVSLTSVWYRSDLNSQKTHLNSQKTHLNSQKTHLNSQKTHLNSQKTHLNSQKTFHTSPSRASYGITFVSILEKNYCVIKKLYCRFRTLVPKLELSCSDLTRVVKYKNSCPSNDLQGPLLLE